MISFGVPNYLMICNKNNSAAYGAVMLSDTGISTTRFVARSTTVMMPSWPSDYGKPNTKSMV